MTSVLKTSGLGVLGMLLAIAGCSDNTNTGKRDLGDVDAGSMTGTFTPCGGDPVGLWTGQSFVFEASDPCTTNRRYTQLPSAIFDIKADTVQIMVTGDVVVESTVDVTCWTFPKTSCSEATSGDMTCTGEPTACACTVAGETVGGWDGSYTIVDGAIVIATSDGPEPLPFCVEGSTLRIRVSGGIWTATK